MHLKKKPDVSINRQGVKMIHGKNIDQKMDNRQQHSETDVLILF